MQGKRIVGGIKSALSHDLLQNRPWEQDKKTLNLGNN